MKKYLLILNILFLHCLHGCVDENYSSRLKSEINIFLSDSDVLYDFAVIIPTVGCSGCITGAEYFFLENVNKGKYKFIFTNIQSRKELMLRLQEDNLKSSSVFIDTLNQFYFEDFKEKIYPYIVTLSDNKAIEIRQL